MTTIVYRNGVMAADSRGYSGNREPLGRKQKIKRLASGTLVGCSSTKVGGGEAIIRWYEAGCPFKPEMELPDTFTLLVVHPNGESFRADDKLMMAGPVFADYHAIGSGSEIALGAMAYSGLCNAIEAVRVACIHDVWSDPPIYAASHEGPMPRLRVDLPPDQIIWIDKEKK
jgi:hypothetical protein